MVAKPKVELFHELSFMQLSVLHYSGGGVSGNIFWSSQRQHDALAAGAVGGKVEFGAGILCHHGMTLDVGGDPTLSAIVQKTFKLYLFKLFVDKTPHT